MTKLRKIIDVLNIGGNIKIIGSYAEHLKGKIKYPNDVDLQDHVFVKNVEGEVPEMTAYKLFVKLLKTLRANPYVYLVDIKAGHDRFGNPSKWTYDQFTKKSNVMSLFHQKSIIKLDLVVQAGAHDKSLVEVSVNYYFELEQAPSGVQENTKTYYRFSEKEVVDSIILDIQKLQEEGNDFKVLKREYMLMKRLNKPVEAERILQIINSPVGKVYQKRSQLKMILELMEDKTGTITRRDYDRLKDLILHNLKTIIGEEGLPKNQTFAEIERYIRETVSVLDEEISRLLSKETKMELRSDKTEKKKKKGGAKLPAALIKQLNIESAKTKGWDMSSFGYKTDRELSTSQFQVYFSPPKTPHDSDSKKYVGFGTVISNIRGTKTKKDVLVDIGLALNYRGKRFLSAEALQKKVVEKYSGGDYRLFIVGSSLGGSIAEWLGKNPELTKGFVSYDIITVGKPVTPVQLLTNDQPGEFQTDVRQEYDPISFLKPLQPHKNDVILESEHGPLNPIKNHMGDSVMSHYMIKDSLIGTARKLPVKNLRKVVLILRQDGSVKRGAGRYVSYRVSGVKKKELQDMVEHLILNHKNIGDAIFLKAMEYINDVHSEIKKKKAN